ncbi:MAG: sialidase family protein, partial [Acidimicrobiales bacterium]
MPISSAGLGSFAGSWIASDPSHPNHLAVAYGEGAQKLGCYLGLSNDGGATWKTQILVGQGGSLPLPSPNTLCTFPSVLFGPDGTLDYAFDGVSPLAAPAAGANHGHYNIYVVTSRSGGTNFSAPADTNAPVGPAEQGGDYIPSMAADPNTGRLVVTWEVQNFITGAGPQPARASVSTNFGGSFLPSVALAPWGFPNASISGNGTIYITFDSFVPTPQQQLVVYSTDGGMTYSAPIVAQTGYSCAPAPPGGDCSTQLAGLSDPTLSDEIAAAPAAGTVYASGQAVYGNQYRVQFSVSHEGGNTWSASTVIAIPTGLSGDRQLFPAMAMAPNGSIDIVYYDFNWVAGLETTYLTSSSNGGNTWSTPLLVSSAPSNVAIHGGPSAAFDNGTFDGENLIADTNSAIYATWTGSRRGSVATAKTDVFSAAVREPGEAGSVLAASNGAVTRLGDVAKLFSAGSTGPVVGVATTPDGGGYWLATS